MRNRKQSKWSWIGGNVHFVLPDLLFYSLIIVVFVASWRLDVLARNQGVGLPIIGSYAYFTELAVPLLALGYYLKMKEKNDFTVFYVVISISVVFFILMGSYFGWTI